MTSLITAHQLSPLQLSHHLNPHIDISQRRITSSHPSNMVSPTSLLSKPKESASWESHNLFARFSELSSVPNHPALTHVPPMTSFPQTQWFLLADESRKIWEKGDMVRGVEMLALKLDREWPDWAVSCFVPAS
jgi:hypothetical protein